MSRPLTGYQVRADINLTTFAVAEYQIRRKAENLDITNSEGAYDDTANVNNGTATPVVHDTYPGLYEGSIGGTRVADVTIKQATADDSARLWGSPLNVFVGARVRLEIWPDRDGTDTHLFPCMEVMTLDEDVNVKGLQVLSATLRSVGVFYLAGDADHPG